MNKPIDRFKIKDSIMRAAVESRNCVALTLVAVDPVIDIYNARFIGERPEYLIYADEEEIISGIEQSLGQLDSPQEGYCKTLREVVDLAKASDRFYAFIMSERYLEEQGVNDLFYLIKQQSIRILPVVLETRVDSMVSKFFPTFANKANSMEAIQPYRRYGVTIGEGWGEQFEDREIAFTTPMHPLIYQHWSKVAKKIEKQKQKLRETKFLPVPDEDEEQTAT